MLVGPHVSKRVVFAATALPGIVIAGLFIGLGRYDIAVGVFVGAGIATVSFWLLSGSVGLIADLDKKHGPNKWYIAAWLVKYVVIAAALFIAFTYFDANPIGMCAGYTIGLLGFVITSFVGMTDSDPDEQ